jgi:molybdate transport system permease protein
MDWEAFALSVRLGLVTLAILVPLAFVLARVLAWRTFRGRGVVLALVALPLVLPPTVIGFYLLSAFGSHGALGRAFEALFGAPLAFSFAGLVAASVIVNLPFAVQPIQNALEAIPRNVRDAARVSGLDAWRIVRHIELPLAWPGLVTAAVLTFAHTLGEFGVVLMVGGSIPGETRTAAIAIYDRVQAFDDRAAAAMSATLLALSLVALALVQSLSRRGSARD